MPFPYPPQEVPIPPSSSYIDQTAWEMVSAHNWIMRVLNRTYEIAPIVDKDDVPHFLEFASLAAHVLHHHHDAEEKFLFPTLAKLQPAETEKNQQQHRAMVEGLEAWTAYIASVKAGTNEYDGKHFMKLMDVFGDVLYEHMVDEIPSITPDVLAKYSKEDIQLIETGMKKDLAEMKQTATWTILPFSVFNNDMSLVPRFPPLPTPVVMLGRHVFSRRYAARWKFSVYDSWGRKRTYKGI